MRQIIISERDREDFIKKVLAVPLGKKKFMALFEIFRDKRTLAQNRLFHMWITCLEKESNTGYTKEEFKIMLKKRFLPYEVKIIDGVTVEILAHTSLLNTKEFSEFIDKVHLYSIEEYCVSLPLPQERGWDEFYLKYGIK